VSWHARAWRLLTGEDDLTHRGLPASELLAPLPLAAVAMLATNDWVLKRSSLPGWLTGKLSDVAGIFVFPLIVTAVVDLVLLGCARARVLPNADFTLRRWKLAGAIAATAVGFCVLKAWPAGSAWLAGIWAKLAGPNRVAVDPSDLLALAVLPLTWWQGRRAIARGAHGRLELALRRARAGHPLAAPYADAAACGADAAIVAELDAAVSAWLVTPEDAEAKQSVASDLARLRA
jgi:hypothetical protein